MRSAATPSRPAPVAVVAQADGSAATRAVCAAPVGFSAIVERDGPAVVNIAVSGRAARPGPDADPSSDEALQEFLRRFGPRGPQAARHKALARGPGSGFIVSADGLILTNAQVVEGAEEITLRLTDRREFRAQPVGSDARTDAAVLRIDARDPPTVQLGDPSRVRVGEPVIAIGSPCGFGNSVTPGSSAPSPAACPTTPASPSCRPTWPPIRAIPRARRSTSEAR
jgi:serine protease Do